MAELNIIHTIPGLSINAGGPSRSVPDLCHHLSNHKACIGLARAQAGAEEVPKSNLVRYATFHPTNGVIQFENTSETFVPDLIHSHSIWSPFCHSVSRYATNRNIPLILSPRGMLEPWALNKSKWKKRLAWLLYQNRDLKSVTAFHATAMSEAENIRKLGFKQPIAIIPNGVELPEAVQRSEVRACPAGRVAQRPGGYEKVAEPKTALFLSRINKKKGLPMLLDVWAKIRPEGWRLVIAGNDDGNHIPEVQAKIRNHGLVDQVEIVGPLFDDAKAQAFRSADLFVLPSFSENFGIVVTEALAYQIPVLTTTGCPWQELETHDCGWWVEPTPEGIEAGLRKAFLTTADERAAMGERGRKLVEEKYLWPSIAEKMLSFYVWILKGGEKPEFVV